MGLLRRRKPPRGDEPDWSDGPEDGDVEDDRDRTGYSRTMEERMRSLEAYSYEYSEDEAAEVEARIRRMFYGAKVEDE